MGYWTRGTMSGRGLPVATSITWADASSLPFSDKAMATNFPSSDGLYQSIAVVPLAFAVFGSNNTRSLATSAVSLALWLPRSAM